MIVAKKYYPVIYLIAKYVMVELPNGTRKVLGDSANYGWGGLVNKSDCLILSFSILADFSTRKIASLRYVNFAEQVIEKLPKDGWVITGNQIIFRYPEDFAEYELENILDAIGSVGK